MWFLTISSLVLCTFVHEVASSNGAASERYIPVDNERSLYKREGVEHTIVKHHATNTTLDFVKNSGICETTPGVKQYSGYIDIGTNQSMWFWFFEARKEPRSAPLALWFNGGPGCSSMIGLFQENGPCRFEEGAEEPTLNPYSWNEVANMLYIDQPFGTGFSNEYGPQDDDDDDISSDSFKDPLEVNSTISAASNVWKFLQAFYDEFPEYETGELGLFTESYGGHYGPQFADHFQTQNEGIASGTVTGQNISLVALGINNGLFDSAVQEKAYVDFSLNNSYGPLINQSFYDSVLDDFNEDCLPALQNCSGLTNDDQDCSNAMELCYSVVEDPLYREFGDKFNPYDIRPDALQPPTQYNDYLWRTDIMKAIGARSEYLECSTTVSEDFYSTGDYVRSYLPALSSVVRSGVTTIIWAGDADYICNWFGNLDAVNALDWPKASDFKDLEVKNYTVNGTVGGTYKTLDNLSWLRVFGAGHEVMFYQPELSLQVFKQTMSKNPIFSTNSDGTNNSTGGDDTEPEPAPAPQPTSPAGNDTPSDKPEDKPAATDTPDSGGFLTGPQTARILSCAFLALLVLL